MIAEILESDPITLSLPESVRMSDHDFFEFCQLNRDWKFERTAEGEILIMAPTSYLSGDTNAELTMQLRLSAKRDGAGRTFDSNTGFILPNGAVRSPDAAWVRKARIRQLGIVPDEFLRLCPDFIVEMRSPSDRLSTLQAKMREYLANGVQLGWLIDRRARKVTVYRPDQPVETLNEPLTISADPELPGFTLDLQPIWDPES